MSAVDIDTVVSGDILINCNYGKCSDTLFFFQMSGGNRGSTPADSVESRGMFSSVLRPDLNNTSHQVGSAGQYPVTSSPGPGLLGQGAPLMALGHNVMFPGGKLMPGSSAHESHRYMAEAYRLAAGDGESHRLPYPVAGSSAQTHSGETHHRSTLDTNSPSLSGERPLDGSGHDSQTGESHYSPPNIPTHGSLESSRLESHSSRILSGLERLPQNGSRSATTAKADNEAVHYGKTAYSSSVSDMPQHSSTPAKSKTVPNSLTGSSMFPMSFPPSYQQYTEESNANFKRHYFDETSSPRREGLASPVGAGGDLTQLSKGRHESGNRTGRSDISQFDSECASQDMYNHENSSRNDNRHEVMSPGLGLLPQVSTPASSDIILHARLPKSRQTKLYKCQICEQEFKNGTQLKNHTWRHTGEKPYACEICQATFTQQSNLKTHMRIHTGERPYKCEECNAAFTQISNLRTHQKTHTGEKPYECDICFTRFSQQSNLKSHKLIHSGERPFKCEECGATFVQSTHLRNHRRIHTDERPYGCEQCGAMFRQLSNLKTHEKIHTGERPYICEECGSAFAQKSNLKSHSVKLHATDGIPSRRGRKKKLEAIRPFTCEECGAKFTMMSNLKIHMRLHTGEKPFQCSLCGASFAQRSNLKAHEQTHSDERPFKCPECPAGFRQKTNLKTHRMKKHPVKSLKIKILQDSQYSMQDQPHSIAGEGSSNHVEEPIIQIKEGKCDQLHLLSVGAMETMQRDIKLESESTGSKDASIAWKNLGIVSEPCPTGTNPYDSPNF